MGMNENLEDLPIELLVFDRHQTEVHELCDSFGSILYPQNELSKATSRILDNKKISENIFIEACAKYGNEIDIDIYDVKRELEDQFSVSIGRYPIIHFLDDELHHLNEETEILKNSFLSNVGFRAVYSE